MIQKKTTILTISSVYVLDMDWLVYKEYSIDTFNLSM